MLIVLAVAGVLVNRSISADPFSTGNGMSRFPGERVDDPFDVEADVVEVAYRHDTDSSFVFSLTNESRWPVRIVGFPRFDSLLRQVAVDVDPTAFDGPTPKFVGFRPFTLAGGDAAAVWVHTRFANCDGFGPSTFATVTALAIRFRVLWATRTRFVELPTGIQVPAPPGSGCPGP